MELYKKQIIEIAKRFKARWPDGKRMPEPHETDTGGFGITLWTDNDHTIVELYLDTITDGITPTLWIGFSSIGQQNLKHLIDAHCIDKPLPALFDKTCFDWRDDVCCFNHTPKMGHYLVETLDNKHYFFGYYSPLNTFDEDKAAAFIEKLKPYSGLSVEDEEDGYGRRSEEGQKKRQVHRMVEQRDAALARECKEKAHYICAVCDFDFVKAYGPLGEKFAEAHHKVALSSLKGIPRVNSHEDLVTLCANCHRMVHRLKGDEKDWLELKDIWTEQRKTHPKPYRIK